MGVGVCPVPCGASASWPGASAPISQPRASRPQPRLNRYTSVARPPKNASGSYSLISIKEKYPRLIPTLFSFLGPAPGDQRVILKGIMPGPPARGDTCRPQTPNRAGRDELAKRFKAAADPFRVVIVRDMWLTGFDAPLSLIHISEPTRPY